MITDNSFVPLCEVVLTLTSDSLDPTQLAGALAAHLYCSGKVGVSKPKNN